MTNSGMEERPRRAPRHAADGRQHYPRYAALWPLVHMGIVGSAKDDEEEDADLLFDLWKELSKHPRPVRVAIMDTSVAIEHPNLNGSRTRCAAAPEAGGSSHPGRAVPDTVIDCFRAIDFASARLGSFPYYGAQRSIGELLAGDPDAAWPQSGDVPLPDLGYDTGLDIPADCPQTKALFGELCQRLQPGQKTLFDTVLPATDPRFSSHGTAIAGLVGARPARVRFADQPERAAEKPGTGLPFSGVNPFCSLIPVSAGFDPDPEQLILALLYSCMAGAQVILLPRDFPDPLRTPPVLDRHVRERSERVPVSDREESLWEELEKLTIALSRHIPIVCAAGNSGDENVIYPASLAADTNGIIAVGAVNSSNRIATYSCRGDLVTVYAPSSDGERLDREETRLDTQDPDYISFPDRIRQDNAGSGFSYLDAVSCDVPGRYGYNSSDKADPYERRLDNPADMALRDFGSFYCLFGGTSAASALVAGFLSLGLTAGRIAAPEGTPPGVAAREWLLRNTVPREGGAERVVFWQEEAVSEEGA